MCRVLGSLCDPGSFMLCMCCLVAFCQLQIVREVAKKVSQIQNGEAVLRTCSLLPL